VWTPERESPSVTRDQGATWKPAQGLPAGTRVVADSQDSHNFYAVALQERTLYRSTDAAATFVAQHFTLQNAPPASTAARGDPRGGQDRLYATPGRTSDLWFAAFDGLYHAPPEALNNKDVSFARLPGVTEIHAFGFGKAAPGHIYPALFLVGTSRDRPVSSAPPTRPTPGSASTTTSISGD
jgi:hypothetical protein